MPPQFREFRLFGIESSFEDLRGKQQPANYGVRFGAPEIVLKIVVKLGRNEFPAVFVGR